jgi:hypothetical protein
MAKLLFKMRNVLADEAQDVRELLEDNKIDYFETFAGNWGVSLPAIWVKNDDQHEIARSLLDKYQAERTTKIREEYELSLRQGEMKSMWHNFLENPIKFVVYMGLVGLVLYLSLQFFLSF